MPERHLALIRTLVVIVTALGLGPSPGAGMPGYFPCPVILFFAPCVAVEPVGGPGTLGGEQLARPAAAPETVVSGAVRFHSNAATIASAMSG